MFLPYEVGFGNVPVIATVVTYLEPVSMVSAKWVEANLLVILYLIRNATSKCMFSHSTPVRVEYIEHTDASCLPI